MSYKHSSFYFGHIVTGTNCFIDFSEGGSDLIARLTLGSYALTDYASEIARALTWAGTQAYDCTIDRETRIITISAASPFSIKFGTGANYGASAAAMAGFPAEDLAAALSHTGIFQSGKAYHPQCPINSYVPFKHWKGASDAAVNISASGRATVVSFGSIQRMKCNIYAISNKDMGNNSAIENNPQAVEEALEFLEYITQKNPVEFMFDRNDPVAFEKCLLESTKDSKSGVSFQLYEGLGKGLRDIYETDTLTFRKME